MAYDEDLAQRLRELVAMETGVTEMKMFGGLAFLIGGNMAVAAGSHGDLLLRVDPAIGKQLATDTTAKPMEMGGRTMNGWLHVPIGAFDSDADLSRWVDYGVSYARSLPPKDNTKSKTTSRTKSSRTKN